MTNGMNELIKELAEQANWWKPLGLPSDWNEGDYVVSPEQMEKFAELIVLECLHNMENCDGDLDLAIWKTKKDFGLNHD